MAEHQHHVHRRRLTFPLAIVTAVLLGTGIGARTAWGVFSSTSGPQTDSVTAAVIPQGNTPSAAPSPNANSATVSISIATVTVGGTELSGYTVRRYTGNTAASAPISGTCGPPSGGFVTCTDAPGDGSWRYADTPTLNLWAGTESAKSSAVTVDTTAPTVSVVVASTTGNEPPNAVKAGSSYDVYADVSDSGSGVAATSVKVDVSAITSGRTAAPLSACSTGCTIAGHTYAFKTASPLTAGAGLANGETPSYAVSAKDLAANVGSQTSPASVDDTGPAVAAVVASTTGSRPANFVKAGATYNVYADVTDALSGVDATTIAADVSAITSGQTAQALGACSSGCTIAGHTYQFKSGTLTAGPGLSDATRPSYAVSARDNLGTSGNHASTATIDNSGPTVAVTFPAVNGIYNASGWTGSITGTFGDSLSGTANASSIQVTITQSSTGFTWDGSSFTSGSHSVSPTTFSAGTWAVTLANASLDLDGTYTVSASASDRVGTSGSSSTVSFEYDTVAPTVTVASDGSTNSRTPTFSGTAGDRAADATQSADGGTVTVYVCAGSVASCNAGSGTLTQTLTATRSGTSWSVAPSTSLAANAQYTVQAAQSDRAGNTGTSSASTFVIDTVVPVPTVTAPAAFVSTTAPTISGTAGTQAADATHSADSTTVTVKIFSGSDASGTLLQTFDGVAVAGGAWSVTASALTPNAQYTVQVSQGDGAANSGSGTQTFVIDTVAPTVTLTALANGSDSNSTAPTITGTADTQTADATHSADDSTVTVKIYAGADTSGTLLQTLTATMGVGGAWSATPSPLTANAQYTVQATQGDGAANTGASTASTFVIDAMAPTVVLSGPANGMAGTSTTPGFSHVCSGAVDNCNAESSPVQTLTTLQGGGDGSVSAASLSASATYAAQTAQPDGVGITGTSSVGTLTTADSLPH